MKIRFVKVILYLVLVSSSCTTNNINGEQDQEASVTYTLAYFDLEKFFREEISKLKSARTPVQKTVISGDAPEEKRVEIKDWDRELALFVQSDINKSAWTGSYLVDSSENEILYTSQDPSLRTKQIRIEKAASGSIVSISVENGQSNMLYQTTEKLYYYPDSMYHIERIQKIRIVGENHYKITGIFLANP